MPKLGKIQLFDSVYTHTYQRRNPSTGKFSKTGKLYFDFTKERKTPDFASNGAYEVVKHSEMKPLSVKAGKAMSRILYALKHPMAAYYTSLSALALAVGAGAYIISENKIQTYGDNTPVVVEQKNDTADVDSAEIFFPSEPDNSYVVQKGDNIWNINKDRIKAMGNAEPSNEVINALKDETIKLNPELKNNGDLIYPGDTIILPAI